MWFFSSSSLLLLLFYSLEHFVPTNGFNKYSISFSLSPSEFKHRFNTLRVWWWWFLSLFNITMLFLKWNFHGIPFDLAFSVCFYDFCYFVGFFFLSENITAKVSSTERKNEITTTTTNWKTASIEVKQNNKKKYRTRVRNLLWAHIKRGKRSKAKKKNANNNINERNNKTKQLKKKNLWPYFRFILTFSIWAQRKPDSIVWDKVRRNKIKGSNASTDLILC